MISQAAVYLMNQWSVKISLFGFLTFYVLMLIWIFRKNSNSFYDKMSKVVFNQGEHHE